MKWQPIETAPKDGTIFVATGLEHGDKAKTRHYIFCVYDVNSNKFVAASDKFEYQFLTLWTPLQPPDDEPQISGGIQYPPV